MAQGKIHLVFKTHLDIGFTDLAEKVRAQYHHGFIPQALETAEHFFREDPDRPKFVWTTGAWLIWDHLNTQGPAEVARLERAIEQGLIAWHALPFTTHSELMSPDLFRAGLSYAAELDARFGKKTIAAKMTDVPGHTRGIVALLAEAGVKFLHIGVNSASPPPEVPEVFRWRGESVSEIVVIYQTSYGATCFPTGFAEGLSFAHTSDNLGPQSVPQTVDVYRRLAAEYPDAEVRAATLDDYAGLLWERRAEFPVVDVELGDSWIHGAASDPVKTQNFLAMRRLYDGFVGEGLRPAQRAFGRALTLVAEHTCGVDVKSYLRDEVAWDRAAFEKARAADFRFAYAEESWAEQRAYLDAAMRELDPEDRRVAGAEVSALATQEIAAAPLEGLKHEIGGWEVAFDGATGDIAALTAPDGLRLEGVDASLFGYRYESYDETDVSAHLATYLTESPEWAVLDHGKPGLERASTRRSAALAPELQEIGRAARGGLVVRLGMPEIAANTLGAPARLDYLVTREGSGGLVFTVQLWDKPANRMPEASFFRFAPAGASGWEFLKTGLWQEAGRVARYGGGWLQAVASVRGRVPECELRLTPLDTPLVGPADAQFMCFNPEPPRFDAGLRFNLHNNKWGTNFPQWWGGDFKARFRLEVGP